MDGIAPLAVGHFQDKRAQAARLSRPALHSQPHHMLPHQYFGPPALAGQDQIIKPMMCPSSDNLRQSRHFRMEAKGQPSAQKLLLDIVNKTEAARRQAYERTAQEFVQYQFEWEEIFEQYRAKGLPLPNAAPHPHDLQFDEATGAITIIGPRNEAEKLKWEKLSDDLQGVEDSIADLKKLRADPKNEDIKRLIEDDIAFEINIRDRIRKALKDWRKRS